MAGRLTPDLVDVFPRFRPADWFSAFQIYLARGRDRGGNRYGDPDEAQRGVDQRRPRSAPQGEAVGGLSDWGIAIC